ncbi:MAG: xanthine dehydrogenase family protein subunit M [Anaerolineales bacterium]|nr:xanthine dehydrogenase family protein subunit M [Anaerolineales bacterium]
MNKRFEYFPARSVDEALRLLNEHSDAEPIAGCTNTLVDVRTHRAHTKMVVDINRLSDLRFAHRDNEVIRIGPLTTLAECLNDPFFNNEAPLLKRMAGEFAGPIIRNRATLGGNIAYASPAADSLPAFLALDANLTLSSNKRGNRTIAVSEFMTGPRESVCEQDELITEISFPALNGDVRIGYFKFALRNAMAISIVSGAVVLRMYGKKIQEASLALGAVAAVPYRVSDAEELLIDTKLTEELIREVAHLAGASCSPINDIRGSADYRRAMVEVMTRRMIQQAMVS